MTLQQVARGAGTHHSNLVRIEQGKNVGVSFYMLLRILRGMRSSLREFDCMKMKTGRRNESVYSFKNQPSWSRGTNPPSPPPLAMLPLEPESPQ